MASAHRPTIASHSAMRSVSNSMSWTNAPGAETPGSSASRPRSCSRSSGASAWPWTVTACCAAAATSSSGSPLIASVQPTSLGAVRQSRVFLVMVVSFSALFSGTGFVDGVERGLFGPAEPAEPGLRRDLADGGLPGLGAQRVPAGLGAGFRHALLAEAVRADLGEQGRRYEQLALAIEAAASAPDQVAAEVAGHLHRAGRDDLAGPRWQRAARHARSLGAMPEAARFWAEAVRCDPEAADLRLELAEAFGWLGQDADFEREWQAALELVPEEQRSVAWSRRGQVLRTIVCNPRASLAAYQRAAELLPADAPPPLWVDILLGAAWCESAAGDPARTATLLDQVSSLVTEPDDRIVAEMANAELMSMIRLSQFTECEAVAARAAAAARRAGRSSPSGSGSRPRAR